MNKRKLSRDKALEEYIISRVKFEEAMLLWNLLKSATAGRLEDPGFVLHSAVELRPTLLEIAVVWFATLMDPGAINVFDIWPILFPAAQQEIDRVQQLLTPHIKILRDLRNKAVFHAERNVVHYFGALVAFSQHKDELAEPLQQFGKLTMKLASQEAVIPGLYEKREAVFSKVKADLPLEYHDSIRRIIGLTVGDARSGGVGG